MATFCAQIETRKWNGEEKNGSREVFLYLNYLAFIAFIQTFALLFPIHHVFCLRSFVSLIITHELTSEICFVKNKAAGEKKLVAAKEIDAGECGQEEEGWENGN